MERDFLSKDVLCQVLDRRAAGTPSADARTRLSHLLESYPELFVQSSEHVYANPVKAVLASGLLLLASNVEVVKTKRKR